MNMAESGNKLLRRSLQITATPKILCTPTSRSARTLDEAIDEIATERSSVDVSHLSGNLGQVNSKTGNAIQTSRTYGVEIGVNVDSRDGLSCFRYSSVLNCSQAEPPTVLLLPVGFQFGCYTGERSAGSKKKGSRIPAPLKQQLRR